MWERLLSRSFLVLILWLENLELSFQTSSAIWWKLVPLRFAAASPPYGETSVTVLPGTAHRLHLCYTLSRQALRPQTPIPTAKLTQMVLLTHITSAQTSWRWKTIYSSEQINHFRTSLGKCGMSHGSDAQEKSLSFACLLLFFLNSPCWLRNTCC